MYKIWKYWEKGQPHVCDYRKHEAARICTGITQFPFTCLKLAIETLEQGVEYVQS